MHRGAREMLVRIACKTNPGARSEVAENDDELFQTTSLRIDMPALSSRFMLIGLDGTTALGFGSLVDVTKRVDAVLVLADAEGAFDPRERSLDFAPGVLVAVAHPPGPPPFPSELAIGGDWTQPAGNFEPFEALFLALVKRAADRR